MKHFVPGSRWTWRATDTSDEISFMVLKEYPNAVRVETDLGEIFVFYNKERLARRAEPMAAKRKKSQ
jgi:hypothetical protein